MSTHQELLNAVYGCKSCESRESEFGFTRPEPNKPPFKFPPTIGALGRARLLFVGINPRLTHDPQSGGYNKHLHDRVLGSFQDFCLLADNRDGEQAYIAPGCKERHYHWHMEVVQKFFGEKARFEDYAAVTELFLCATKDSKRLPIAKSPCAAKYFEQVFLKVRPMIVLPAWVSVLKYFQDIAGEPGKSSFFLTVGGHTALVVYLPQQR